MTLWGLVFFALAIRSIRALDLVVFRKEILRSLEQTAGKGWGGKKAEDGKTSD